MPIQSKSGGKTADKPAKPAAKTSSKTVTKDAAKPVVKAAASKPKAATAAKPAGAATAARKAPVASRASAGGTKKSGAAITPDQRRCYVEVAAYYIAERRGFSGGSEVEDWVQAEAEIERLLREGVLNP